MRIVEIPTELREKFLELQRTLKNEYGIDILSKEAGDILDVFEDKFRPLVVEFQHGRVGAKEIAVTLQEYAERLRLLSYVVAYAANERGVNFINDELFKPFAHNLENVSKEVQRLFHDGKSLKDAYQYMLEQAAAMTEGSKELQ